VRTVGNVITVSRNDSIRNRIGNLEGIVIMSRNHKWEEGDVEPVTMPKETYGVCVRPRCKNKGDLANGLCQSCWDSGSSNKRIRADRKRVDSPLIIIS
jgi:hypothetical protein